MFFTYLGRELRRRMRQAAFAALGLAIGIGLVITVTAASAGVRDAQSKVLHSLYGVGTDITVTKAPSANSGGPFGFRVGQRPRSFTRPKAGTTFTRSTLTPRGLGTLTAADVRSVSALHGVAVAGGALDLTDLSISGKIPSQSGGGGFGGGGGGFGGASNFKVSSFTVNGADLSAGEVGPLSSAKIVSGRTFTAADATANDAVVDAGYARQNKLSAGSTITVGSAKFKVIGIVSQPQGGSPPEVYIPLARAQALAGMKNDVNTIYVSADSAANINAVSSEISSALPKASVTNSSSLANEVTGSISNAGNLANNLGRWLAVAVLAAAFLLASLLMMTAVAHRVREFGTLKALGWRSRRIIGQVMGEAVVIGIAGGIIGVALGFAGARLVAALAPPLTASTQLTTGSATPGGARAFGPPGGGFGGPPGGGGGGGGGGFFRRLFGGPAPLAVHLTAPVTVEAVALAVVLAIAGGLIAGGFGSWRAARLRPAAALARVQ
jgi:ABC-type antimicrobial peptide transport system permease subunit